MTSSPNVLSRSARLPGGLVDWHTHAIDPDLPTIDPGPGGAIPQVRRTGVDEAEIWLAGRLYRRIDSRCWSAETRLRDMDAEGVAAQVLSPIPVTLCLDQPAAPVAELARAQNDFLARLTRRAPDRLFALGCVPLQDPGLAVTELIRCVDELGLLGVEVGTRIGERALADPAHQEFFATAARLGAVVFVHPVDQLIDPRLIEMGIAFGMGMPDLTGVAGAGLVVSDLLDRASIPTVLLAHGGGTLPAVLPRLSRGQDLAGRPATAMDAARHLWSDSLTYDPFSLLLAARRFGEDHVVLGTDYPFAVRETPAGAVLDDTAVPPGLREQVGRTNPLALLDGVTPSGTHRPPR